MTQYAAYFEADSPENFRWLMRFLLNLEGVERGSSVLQVEGFRDPPILFPKDPRKNHRVLSALDIAKAKFDKVWKVSSR